MKNVVVSNWSLVLAFALVLVSIGISAKEIRTNQGYFN